MPSVQTGEAGEYTIIDTRAFVGVFTETVDTGQAREFTLDVPADATTLLIGLDRIDIDPVNLLTVPAFGVFLGDYRLRVVRSDLGSATTRLACSIANSGVATATDAWELRGAAPAPASGGGCCGGGCGCHR